MKALKRAERMNEIEYHRYTIGRILVFLIGKGLARVDLHETERRGDEEQVQADICGLSALDA